MLVKVFVFRVLGSVSKIPEYLCHVHENGAQLKGIGK